MPKSRTSEPADQLTRPGQRLVAIDVFRGLTIFAMIFVNNVWAFHGVPWWMKHMKGGAGMTFVDVVFPAFLFIVGTAVPPAIERRLRAGTSHLDLLRHIALRTLSLLAIGVFMVNMGNYDAATSGLSKAWWILLVYLGVILLWNDYPATKGRMGGFCAGLRVIGALLLVGMAALYRRQTGDGVGWMQTSWWGILGLIGWAYLACCLVYLAVRHRPFVLMAVTALLIALYVSNERGVLAFLGRLHEYINVGRFIGTHGAITLAGAVACVLVYGQANLPPRVRAWTAGAFGLGLAAGGLFLAPRYGVDKNTATPSWALYSAALSCGVFLLIWWAFELRRGPAAVRWFFETAGRNALLAFIMPAIVLTIIRDLMKVDYYTLWGATGLWGIAQSLLFSTAIVLLCGLLYRLRLRLKL